MTDLIVQNLVRETVVSGTGNVNVQGLVRESVVAGLGVLNVGGLARESLVYDGPASVFVGGLVREALVSGIGLSGTIAPPQSSLSGTSTVSLPATNFNATIQAGSGISGYISVNVYLSGRIVGGSGISATQQGQAYVSKLESYAIIYGRAVQASKFLSYGILTIASESLAKAEGYVVLNSRVSADLAKVEGYAVLKPPPSEDLSKINSYAVLQPPPRMTLFKANAYMVVRAVVTPGDEWPWYVISSL